MLTGRPQVLGVLTGRPQVPGVLTGRPQVPGVLTGRPQVPGVLTGRPQKTWERFLCPQSPSCWCPHPSVSCFSEPVAGFFLLSSFFCLVWGLGGLCPPTQFKSTM